MFGEATRGFRSGDTILPQWLVVNDRLHHDFGSIDKSGVVGGQVGGELSQEGEDTSQQLHTSRGYASSSVGKTECKAFAGVVLFCG